MFVTINISKINIFIITAFLSFILIAQPIAYAVTAAPARVAAGGAQRPYSVSGAVTQNVQATQKSVNVGRALSAGKKPAAPEATYQRAYIGLQLGWGDIYRRGLQQSDLANSGITFNSFSSVTRSQAGLAGDVYAGYYFYQYVALELAYTRFTDMRTHAKATGLFAGSPFSANASAIVKTDAFDLAGKIVVPLKSSWFKDLKVYGKLGVAFLMERVTNQILTSPFGVPMGFGPGFERVHRFLPIFGLGASYLILPYTSLDLTWTHIQAVGSNNKAILTSPDFFGAGLTYTFW